METTCRPRRRHTRGIPLPLLFVLALLLFAAGLSVGWNGAVTYDRASIQALAAANPIPTPVIAAPPALQTAAPASDKPVSTPAGESWVLTLVNFENSLPDGFAVPELTRLRNGQAVDSRVYPALQRMMDDARAAGLDPLICSSFRTWDEQEQLFEEEVQNWLNRGYIRKDAEIQAAIWVARPGASEHQTGLAVDIVDLSYQVLDEEQESTPAQQWLMAHCVEYGFILRYPAGKSDFTGVGYEPWHYRYVGVEAAREITEGGLCLEEYLA